MIATLSTTRCQFAGGNFGLKIHRRVAGAGGSHVFNERVLQKFELKKQKSEFCAKTLRAHRTQLRDCKTGANLNPVSDLPSYSDRIRLLFARHAATTTRCQFAGGNFGLKIHRRDAGAGGSQDTPLIHWQDCALTKCCYSAARPHWLAGLHRFCSTFVVEVDRRRPSFVVLRGQHRPEH